MSPNSHFSRSVQNAVTAALSDIHLLRFLTMAKSPEDANAILRTYKPGLELKGSDLDTFWTSLTKGQACFTAAEIVAQFDIFMLKNKFGKDTLKVWVPQPPVKNE